MQTAAVVLPRRSRPRVARLDERIIEINIRTAPLRDNRSTALKGKGSSLSRMKLRLYRAHRPLSYATEVPFRVGMEYVDMQERDSATEGVGGLRLPTDCEGSSFNNKRERGRTKTVLASC
jgi:hypothetical protein